MQLITVRIDKPEATNFILGQTHFIKSVEDIHEALVGSSRRRQVWAGVLRSVGQMPGALVWKRSRSRGAGAQERDLLSAQVTASSSFWETASTRSMS